MVGTTHVVALLLRLLQESGDPRPADFDLEAWVGEWLHAPLRELAGKTPAEMLRDPGGQHLVEVLLLRLRGGLPA